MYLGLGLTLSGAAMGAAAGQWLSTLEGMREFLSGNSGADNPHSLPAMPSPPTVTTTTADLLPTYPTNLMLNSETDRSRMLIEDGRFALAATTFGQPYAATRNATTTEKIASRISVTADADAIAFYVLGSTLPYRFLVDDQYVDFVGTVPAATTGTGSNYIVLTFASKTSRKITIELQQGQAVRRIMVKSGDTFAAQPPAAKGKRMIVAGDSITGSAIATHFGDGCALVAGDYLGMEVWPSGVGSTGYVATASGTRYKLAERLGDINTTGPWDIVVVAMGINDIGLSGITEEANACFDSIRANNPAALVFVLGPWDAAAPSPPVASYGTCKAAIQAAVASRPGFWFIDAEGVAYTKADAVHPDTFGHATLGAWLNTEIRTLIAA